MQDGEGRREGWRKEKRQGGMHDKLYSGSISSFSDSRCRFRYQNRFRPEAEIHNDQVPLLLLARAYRLRNRHSTKPNACDIYVLKIDYNILEFPEFFICGFCLCFVAMPVICARYDGARGPRVSRKFLKFVLEIRVRSSRANAS